MISVASQVYMRPNASSSCDGTDQLSSSSGSSGDHCSAASATSSTSLVFRRKRVSLTQDDRDAIQIHGRPAQEGGPAQVQAIK